MTYLDLTSHCHQLKKPEKIMMKQDLKTLIEERTRKCHVTHGPQPKFEKPDHHEKRF